MPKHECGEPVCFCRMSSPKLLLTLLALLAVMQTADIDAATISTSDSQVAAILDSLDYEIANRDIYIGRRQQSIDSLRNLLSTLPQDRQPDVIMQIAEKYRSFDNDSALIYLTKGYDLTLASGRDSLANIFRMQRAMLLPLAGFIKEGVDEFNAIDTSLPSAPAPAAYFEAGRQMYFYIAAFYINYPPTNEYYRSKAFEYQTKLNSVLTPTDPLYMLNTGEYYYLTQEYSKARAILQQLTDHLDPSDNLYARATYTLGAIAKAKGDHNSYIYNLARSSISDLKGATLEVSSLQELGKTLFEHGDLNRADNYLAIALKSAVDAHAEMRIIQTAEALPIITEAHRLKIKQSQQRLYWVIAAMGLLVAVIIGILVILRCEVVKMRKLQNSLSDANRIKNVYIGQFINLCSIYMDKLNNFCKLADRKISAGKVEELHKLTKSGKFVEEQSKEFYEVFDDAFLHIYPSFVENVNALLMPDAQITLKEDEKLNTDLRILAFMKLGIDDSGRIAEILNYSVNTIYVYRNKLKNRAVNRDTFEVDVMKISSI